MPLRSSTASTPVCTSADLIWLTVHVGCRCARSAAAPATCGAAMLVPETAAHPPETEERTPTPGAATSGLRRSDIVVGPTEEKSACTGVGGFPVIYTAPTVIARTEFSGDETEPAP